MSSSDLVQAFYGLNHRFNLIVYQSVRHFTISKDTNEKMFDELKPNIKKMIEKICIDAHLLPYVFLSTCSYSNLRSVVLRFANVATVDLHVDCDSAKCTIQSCLNILRVCNILPVDWIDDNWFSDGKYHHSKPKEDFQVCSLKHF